jgi:hypothetical protein
MGLTAQGGRAHNRAVAHRHKLVHLFLVVIAFAANAALAPCGGWQPTAEARMACCAGAMPCAQADADNCCVAGEQRQHGETFGLIAHAIVPGPGTMLAFVNTAPVAYARAVMSRSARPLGPPPDTQLLLSVFLI